MKDHVTISQRKKLPEKSKKGGHINELIYKMPGIKLTCTQSHRWQPYNVEGKKTDLHLGLSFLDYFLLFIFY